MDYTDIIEQIMREAGFSKRYKGYRCLSRCLALALDNSSIFECVVKDIYMPVADELKCSYICVERNIRNIRDVHWNKGLKAYMESVTGAKYDKKPCISEMILVFFTQAEYMIKNSKMGTKPYL